MKYSISALVLAGSLTICGMAFAQSGLAAPKGTQDATLAKGFNELVEMTEAMRPLPDVSFGVDFSKIGVGNIASFGVSARVTTELLNQLLPYTPTLGARAEFDFQLPADKVEIWGGVQGGVELPNGLSPYVFVDLGDISGFKANRVGAGFDFRLNNLTSLSGEGFGRGGIGTITEGGFKLGIRIHLNGIVAPPPDEGSPTDDVL